MFSLLVINFGFYLSFEEVEIAQARPERGRAKPNKGKPKRHRQGQHRPPTHAPAWGRRCNRGVLDNHPGDRNCTPMNEEDNIIGRKRGIEELQTLLQSSRTTDDPSVRQVVITIPTTNSVINVEARLNRTSTRLFSAVMSHQPQSNTL